MATTRGRCVKSDYCSLASLRRDIEVPIGKDFVCPECGSPLSAPPMQAGGGLSRTVALLGAACLLVGAGGVGAYVLFTKRPGPAGASIQAGSAGASVQAGPAGASVQAGPAGASVQAGSAGASVQAGSAGASVQAGSAGASVQAGSAVSSASQQTPAPSGPAPAFTHVLALAAIPPAASVTNTGKAMLPPPMPDAILLRLRGSNTIGATLAPKLAQAFLAETGDTDITITPMPTADETKITGTRAGTREAIVVAAHGSATAFTGLAAGDTDIGMSSRRIKPAEHDSLAALGDLTSPAAEHVLALDGIAVIINPDNPVTDLSRAQLRDIFSGAVTDWSKVGGRAGPIHVLARDDKSGTYDTFKSLVMDKAKLAAATRRLEDSRELATAVTSDQAAIGFVGLPYVADTKPIAIAELGATPLLPNRLTVATEDYPLSRRLFLYTPTATPNPLAQRFVAYALSRAGQAIVEQAGFIPLTIKTEAAPIPTTASARYRALVGRAQRLSTNFRFQPNSTNLDNRGQRDLDRLVNFMISMHAQGDHVTLIGFADNQGAARTNVAVSQKRADAVAALLARRGVKVGHVAAFGADLPVADNASDDGREKNRRVEVYLSL